MTSTKVAEAKGIALILLVLIILAFVMMAASGKLQEWFGIRLTPLPDVTDRIAFVSDRNGHNDIWVMNRDGSGQKALTNDQYDDLSPVWSPDGTEIAFISNRDKGRYGLFAISYDGERIRKLSLASGTKSAPSFSPDGKEIAFLNSGNVWASAVDGRNDREILPSPEEQSKSEIVQETNVTFSQPKWTADGSLLAAVRKQDSAEMIALLDTSTNAANVVKDNNGNPVIGDRIDIAWSNSGRKLACAVILGRKSHYLLVSDQADSSLYPLIQSNDPRAAALQPTWSPDDSQIAAVTSLVTSPDDITSTGLILISSDGAKASNIVKGRCDNPRWSGDGKSIIFTKTDKTKKNVWIVDIDNHSAQNLTQNKGNNFDANWAPSSKK